MYQKHEQRQEINCIFPQYTKRTQQLPFKNINLNVDHHTSSNWFIHSPKHRKNNVSKPENLIMIILKLVCESDIN